MRYQHIPDTDLNPSVICLGGVPLGVDLDEITSFALLDAFVEKGGNFVDTALVYGEWLPNGKGLSEKTIGKWLKARGNRQEIIINTKGAHPRLNSMSVGRLSPEEIVSDLDESLVNLGIETIDLYWLHRDDTSRPVGEILTTLNEQAQAGKIGYFGCSNWRSDRIIEVQRYASDHGLQPFVANQEMWSLATPNLAAFQADPTMVWLDEAAREYHRESGLAALAYTSQARGFFPRLEKDGADGLPEHLRKNYLNPENLGKMARLKEVSRQTGFSVGVLALAYLISQPFPTFAIAASTTQAQLADNLQAGDARLDPALIAYLDGE